MLTLLLSCGRCLAMPAFTGSATVEVEPQPVIAVVKSGQIYYAPLDRYGRPVGAVGIITPAMLTSLDREPSVVPPAFQQASYPFIPALHLYHRCHLIAHQLGGNESLQNVITGTQFLNISGMVPIENRVRDYIQSTGDNVFYQVTPAYVGNNLIASGVYIRALSNDRSLDISVYCFNVQPGVRIDFRSGFSVLAETQTFVPQSHDSSIIEVRYILNTNPNRKRFHYPWCSSVAAIKDANRSPFYGDRQILIDAGYTPCGECKP